MSKRSQSQQSVGRAYQADSDSPYTLGQQHLDEALSRYRPRFAPGHQNSVAVIENATREVVNEMRGNGEGPVAVILAIKQQLDLYPACNAIRDAVVRKCIEGYYD